MTEGNTVSVSRYLHIFGMTEAQVAESCAEWLEEGSGVSLTIRGEAGTCRLRASAQGETQEDALDKLEGVIEEIEEQLGKCVFAVSESRESSMEEAAVHALAQNGLTVATAESCTGGLIAAKLVNVPGCSEVLNEAHVTYANEAKMKYCGVRQETLAQHGAVSEETVREMSEGLRMRSGADIVVASSGIAGPGGGTPEKPVGLVYLACASANGTTINRLQLDGNREQIRNLAALHALDMARRAALGYQ